MKHHTAHLTQAGTFLFPLPPSFTLFNPLPGFHAVLLIQHSHPSLSPQAAAACYANSHRLPTTLLPPLRRTVLHCIIGRVCPECDVGVLVASFLSKQLWGPPNWKPLPNFTPQNYPMSLSLCLMYRMVGSSLPFRKLAENRSAGMTQQERRLWCVEWMQKLFSQRQRQVNQLLIGREHLIFNKKKGWISNFIILTVKRPFNFNI